MPPSRRQTPEAAAFFAAAYAAIQEIPHGKVTSYAHIARLIGRPECPRQVGVCLKHLPSDPTQKFREDTVPWQRVINAKGSISPRGPGSTTRQAAALRREGVQVSQNAMGEFFVDFGEYGWFPEMLPSEEAEMEGSSEDESDEEGIAAGG